MTLKRPMLASPTKEDDLKALAWPMLGSYKIDGVRATVVNGRLMSRTMKPIPNRYTQSLFGLEQFEGLDGELVVGEPNDPNCMQYTMSGVMSRDGSPSVTWYIFDKWDVPGSYATRAFAARQIEAACMKWVGHRMLNSYEEMLEFEHIALELGYEGIMLRHPLGIYKQGRSTLKEGLLLKVKRFVDSEAEVIGYKELMHNNNEAEYDERGYTKRSTHKANKSAAETLGALAVRDIHTGQEFDVGTGFTAEQRKNLWEGRKHLIGKLITYKHFPVGVKDLPRFPTFKSFRDRRDI